MYIQIIYQEDKRLGIVHKFRLKSLNRSGQLFAFRRGNEWVIVEKDQIRGAGGSYSGPERRGSSNFIDYSTSVSAETDLHASAVHV